MAERQVLINGKEFSWDMSSEVKESTTLKICKSCAQTDENGRAVVSILIPGIPGTQRARYIYSGIGWFDSPAIGDEICCIELVDKDNILGYGTNFVVGSYTEQDLTSDEKGWFIPHHAPVINMSAVGGPGFLVAGFYLVITAVAASSRSDTFRINLRWGSSE